jgi:hypothetical protein
MRLGWRSVAVGPCINLYHHPRPAELFPKAVDGPGDSSGFSFSVDVLDAVDYLL